MSSLLSATEHSNRTHTLFPHLFTHIYFVFKTLYSWKAKFSFREPIYSTKKGKKKKRANRCLVSLVGRAPVCWFSTGSNAARPTLSKRLDFLVFSDKDKKRSSRLRALTLIWFLWDVKEPTPLFEKSRGRRPRCCGQPSLITSFSSWVGWVQ